MKAQRLPTHDPCEDDHAYDTSMQSDEAFDALSTMSIDAPSRRASNVEIELSDITPMSPHPADGEIITPVKNPIAPKLAIQIDDELTEMPSNFSTWTDTNTLMYSPSTDINEEFEADPSTDPCADVCEKYIQFPKIGHSYVVYQKNQSECIVGPHWTGLTYTASLITGSTIAYLIQQAPTLPGYCTIIALVMATISLTFLFLTGCSDPGIVRTDSGPPASGAVRYCEQCQVHMPPRAYHCDDCNCCIEELDHHCPWMGKCVGKKNMLWFQCFNVSWIAYAVFALVSTFSNAANSLETRSANGHLRALFPTSL